MKTINVESEVVAFIGDAYESVSVALLSHGKAILIDSLASREDAIAMRHVLCDEMGHEVSTIVCTHFMDDHMAGIRLHPHASLVAHRFHRHTFLTQADRDDSCFATPTVEVDGNLTIKFGRHVLRLMHNPGKTLDHITVDVPTSDLACVGDNIVGNIVYLSKADPAQIDEAICRVQRLGRARIAGGHMGVFDAGVLANARYYLSRLRADFTPLDAGRRRASAAASVEAFLAPGVSPTTFEREWHQRNLEIIAGSNPFALDAELATRADAGSLA